MKTVLVTDYAWPDLEIERAMIEAAGFKLISGPAEALSADKIAALAAQHRPSAILTCWAQVNEAAIEACPDIAIVARIGVGLDNIDRAAAARRGVAVTNVPDYCVEEVSDHAVGFLLALARGIVAFDREVKRGLWEPGTARLRRVRDMTVGIAGYGRIGRRTAKKLAAFGVKLLATDVAPPVETTHSVEFVDLRSLARRSDAIIIHLPLTPETRHMFDASLLRQMKQDAILINVSRGQLIDSEALLAALDGSLIAGAALDVVEGEPNNMPTRLIGHPRVIATPHIAFSSTASLHELRRRATEEVVRVLRGKTPPSLSAPTGGMDKRARDMSTRTAEISAAPQFEIVSFLRDTGLVSADDTPRPTALTGGVSSDIWKVETSNAIFVVKRALSRLRVAREWTAPVNRNANEVNWMTSAGAIVRGAVPRILAHDPAIGAFAMEFLDPVTFPVWKWELAAGRCDPAFAAKVGSTIAKIHAATAHSKSVAERFDNDAVFHSIRLEPYLEATARVHIDLASILMALSRDTLATKVALVHGDISPKNILVGPVGPLFLDAECAWFGDPAFDLAFCLNHLHLKCILVPAAFDQLMELHEALSRAYLEGVTWEESSAVEHRTTKLLPALLLARVDGKSPVEYIVKDCDKLRVRQIARTLIASPVATLAEIRATWTRVAHG